MTIPPDLPPDLPRLHMLRTWLWLQLERVDAAIHTAETGTEPWLSGPAPGWCVEPLPTGVGRARRAVVHRTDCWSVKGAEEVGRETAVAVRGSEGGEPCQVCQPERELGG